LLIFPILVSKFKKEILCACRVSLTNKGIDEGL